MSQRPNFDPYGGRTPLVDSLIGDAYPTVKRVSQHLPYIEYLAQNLGELRPRDVEIRGDGETSAIQWRYVGDDTWVNLVDYSSIQGPSIEMRQADAYVQYRPVGTEDWVNLIPVADITGKSAEMRVSGSMIQWHLVGDDWQNLIDTVNLPVSAPQQAALDAMQAAVDEAVGQVFDGSPVYPDVATGRAAVTDGAQFKVQSGDESIAYSVYQRVNASTSTHITDVPAASVMAEKANKTDLLEYSTLSYTAQQLAKVNFMVYEGDGPVVPVVSDDDNKVLLGVNTATGAIVGDIASDSVVPVLSGTFPADLVSVEYAAGGPVPVVTDSGNRVMLGVDSTNGEIIGRLPMPVQGTLLPQRFGIFKPARDGGWLHYLHYGQSLSLGAYAVEWSVVQAYSNITFGAGPKATKAGSTGQNPGTDTTKALIEDNLDNDGSAAARGETGIMAATDEVCERQLKAGNSLPVIFGSAAGHVSYTIAQLGWSAGWSQVLRDHIDEAKARAAESGVPYDLLPIVWVQGEANSGSTPENYLNALRNLRQSVSDYAARPGRREVPFLLYQTPRNNISRAQFIACDGYDEPFMHGTAIYDLPSVDATHLTAFGYHKMCRRMGRAMNDFVNGLRPRCIWPKGAIRRGNVIRWSFDVPAPPLVIDITNISTNIENRGFSVAVNGATVSISSVEVDGSDVVITLADAPDDADAVEARYAYDTRLVGNGWSAETQNRGGNLIDSTTDTFWYAGVEYPLPYVMPHCHRSVTNLKTGANGQ